MKNPLEVVTFLTETKGLTFNKSLTTDSYYCNELRLRISNHYSKFVQKSKELYNIDNAIDIVLSTQEVNEDFVLKLVFSNDFFNALKNGVEIEHERKDIVGDIKYISHSVSEKYVEVKKLKDGSIVKFDFERINLK